MSAQLLRFIGKDLENIEFDSWLDEKPRELRSIAKKWFGVMSDVSDEVQPIFHDGYPIVCVDSAPFAYVNAFTGHVNVGFFYGAELYDKHKLLEGTGRLGRHIKLRPEEDYDEEAIAGLIELAFDDIVRRLGEE